jgi:hypothetical protein
LPQPVGAGGGEAVARPRRGDERIGVRELQGIAVRRSDALVERPEGGPVGLGRAALSRAVGRSTID